MKDLLRVLEGEWGVGICMKYSINCKEGHLRQLGKFLAARKLPLTSKPIHYINMHKFCKWEQICMS